MFETTTNPPGKQRAEAIANLNDDLRRRPTGPGKRLMVTPGVRNLGPVVLVAALRQIAAFDAFTNDNNFHGERDFGKVTVGGTVIWFKIDCYAPDMEHASDDPADPAKTVRVMTLMLPEEY